MSKLSFNMFVLGIDPQLKKFRKRLVRLHKSPVSFSDILVHSFEDHLQNLRIFERYRWNLAFKIRPDDKVKIIQLEVGGWLLFLENVVCYIGCKQFKLRDETAPSPAERRRTVLEVPFSPGQQRTLNSV